MFSIATCPLPDNALLTRYAVPGTYTDCFATRVPFVVSHEQFVRAFYSTSVFKLERLILTWALSRPSTDAQAAELAAGTLDAFSAWEVEARAPDQLLMCDMHGRTRSWLMTAPRPVQDGPGTWLYFGSAVVPVRGAHSGELTLGTAFRALLGFHKVYSVVLLGMARLRLQRRRH